MQFSIKQSPAQQWAGAWAIRVNGWPLMHTSLCCPDDVKNYGRKWCKWWPGEAKTLCKGSLMRVWLTMDQNETRNNGTQVTDNIHSLDQMLVWEKKGCSLIIWTFELLEPRLRPTWMLQSLIRQRWEAELLLMGSYLIPTSVCTGSSRCFLLGFCWFLAEPRACTLACPPPQCWC